MLTVVLAVVASFQQGGRMRMGGIVRRPGRTRKMKLYVGVETEVDRRVVVTSSTGQFEEYSLSAERYSASTDFTWGPDRSGNAGALAQAILADHLAGEARDASLCRRFEETLIAGLPTNFWVLSEREVAATIARLAAEPA
jgi:hypothetical protein